MAAIGEQGSGALAVLPILLVIGLPAMLGWQVFLDASGTLIHDEQRYLEAFHQAESALSWAMTEPWRGEDGECRRPGGEAFRACLRAPGLAGEWMLQAESAADDGLPGEVSLYRRVALRRTGGAEQRADKERRSRMLIPLPNGWLDYDPG